MYNAKQPAPCALKNARPRKPSTQLAQKNSPLTFLVSRPKMARSSHSKVFFAISNSKPRKITREPR